MKYYVYYYPNGKVDCISSQPPNDVIANEKNLSVLETELMLDVSKIYVSNYQITPLPDRPSFDYTFNYESFVWEDVRPDEQRVIEIKIIRAKLLEESDWTDTVSAKSRLGDQLYAAWQTYRQALRDIPTQTGYPRNVVWPTKPE